MRHLFAAASCLVVASALAGCAVAPKHTPEEQAILDEAAQRRIAPRSKEAREAIAELGLLEQAAFWSEEYDNNPADIEAAAAYAEVARRIGQPDRAASVANQVLTQHPDHVALLMTLGAALIADGRGAAAVEPLSHAVRLAPANASALTRLGVALDHTERHEEARARYHDALALGGESMAVRANLGLSYLMEGDPIAAEIELRHALALPGAGAQVRQNLALTLALQGRYAEAETLAQQDLSAEAAADNVAAVRALTTRPARWDRLRAAYDD